MESKHFSIKEFVPEYIYLKYGDFSRRFLDPNLVKLCNFLRERFGKAYINNWAWGGDYDFRGFRTPKSKYFSETSQHTAGRAADMIFYDYTSEEIRRWLEDNWEKEGLGFPITVEEGVDWLHVDVRWSNKLFNSFYP